MENKVHNFPTMEKMVHAMLFAGREFPKHNPVFIFKANVGIHATYTVECKNTMLAIEKRGRELLRATTPPKSGRRAIDKPNAASSGLGRPRLHISWAMVEDAIVMRQYRSLQIHHAQIGLPPVFVNVKAETPYTFLTRTDHVHSKVGRYTLVGKVFDGVTDSPSFAVLDVTTGYPLSYGATKYQAIKGYQTMSAAEIKRVLREHAPNYQARSMLRWDSIQNDKA